MYDNKYLPTCWFVTTLGIASYELQNLTNVETDMFKKHLDDWLRTIPDTPKIDSYGASVPAASNSIVDQCMTKW